MIALVFACCLMQTPNDELLLLENKKAVAMVELKIAELKLIHREKKFKRLQILASKNVIQPEILDELEFEMEAHRLEVDLRRLALARVDIEISIAKKKGANK